MKRYMFLVSIAKRFLSSSSIATLAQKVENAKREAISNSLSQARKDWNMARWIDKCWVSGHDWEVIDTHPDYWAEFGTFNHERKVCLKCKAWVDGITPHLRAVHKSKEKLLSREQRAKKIWDDRYNPNH